MATNTAIEMAFGNYNKELYSEYGLFGYGGYSGIGVADFEAELTEIIKKNLEYKPKNALKSYSNLYRLNDISCEIGNYYTLDEDAVLLSQISDYIYTSVIDNVKNYITDTNNNAKTSINNNLLDNAIKYENGEYDSEYNVDYKDSDENNNQKNKDALLKKDIDKELESDCAGGNPIEALKELLNNGLLSLVCDVSKVSETKIEAKEYNVSKNDDGDNSSVAKFFKSLFNEDEITKLEQKNLLQNIETGTGKDKLKYICYAQDVFSSYIDDKYNTLHYGLEYLIAGKESEKENLAYIVRRLLILRTLINMIYVSKDPLLQSKSLATATAIVGFTGVVPAIEGVKWLILTILAFEEACVDVTALLSGRRVPLIKNASNFKMKYEEICLASYNLFAKKGQSYKKDGNSKISTDISYKQYLLMLELLISKEKLKNRTIDIIQFDLRKRFNQTFEFCDCICAIECNINYNIPYTYSYIQKNKSNTQSANKSITANYSYIDNIWD